MDPRANEEVMWLRLKDAQREAETRRLLREARLARAAAPSEGRTGFRRWLAAARQVLVAG